MFWSIYWGAPTRHGNYPSVLSSWQTRTKMTCFVPPCHPHLGLRDCTGGQQELPRIFEQARGHYVGITAGRKSVGVVQSLDTPHYDIVVSIFFFQYPYTTQVYSENSQFPNNGPPNGNEHG